MDGKIALVGLHEDLDQIEALTLPGNCEYSYCSQFEHVPLVDEAAEVVFVISHFNQLSSHLILLLEEVQKRDPPGERWLFRLDRSSIMFELYPVIQGLPEGPPWLQEVAGSSS